MTLDQYNVDLRSHKLFKLKPTLNLLKQNLPLIYITFSCT